MKYRILLFMFLTTIPSGWLCAQTKEWNPENYSIPTTEREDGRFSSSYGVAWTMLSHTAPKYAFRTDFTPKEFHKWRKGLRKAMSEIMHFPKQKNQPSPVLLKCEHKDGYHLEKWEFYPLPQCVSTFLMLIPDHLEKPVPAIMCIPGSGQCKEELVGEPGEYPNLTPGYKNPKVTHAVNLVKAGYIAVVVDNPASGEASDLEKYTTSTAYDYDVVSRLLLELGWSYLGYTSYLDMQVLEWMKTEKRIQKERIILSGFSLGTEPMMVLGVIDPSVFAFVYNDFLCQTQERAEVMTKPNQNGRRGFPNSIRHLIPNFWTNFNFPDIVASLAPRPIILTEGGLDRDLSLVRKAYEIAQKPDNAEIHHQPKYADPAHRKNWQKLPQGLGREFYDMVNVDGKNHYYKSELIIPWLNKILGKSL